MGRMSELDIEIRERLAACETPAKIARDLNIPQHWVDEMSEEDEYIDYMAAQAAYHAESADLDAQAYGTR
jgi:hypothetical protein